MGRKSRWFTQILALLHATGCSSTTPFMQLCDDQQAGNAMRRPCQCTSFSQEVFCALVTAAPLLRCLLCHVPGTSHDYQILLHGLGYDCSVSA